MNFFIAAEGNCFEDLDFQAELYNKYFMDSPYATVQDIGDDFLAQPSGVAQKKRVLQVVASLVLYPSGIETAWLSIESLFRQKNKADRVILNVFQEDFPGRILPWTIQQQVKRGLEINWCTYDLKEKVSLTRSDILHPSPLIPYFKSHQLDELVIIPYRAHIPFSPKWSSQLDCKELDTASFKRFDEQCKLLGGEARFILFEDLAEWTSKAVFFNPSLTVCNDKIYMAFRAENLFGSSRQGTFIVELKDLFPFKEDVPLTISNPFHEDSFISRGVDARLFVKDKKLFVSYVLESSNFGYTHYVEVAEYVPRKYISDGVRPDIGNNKELRCRQKNWLFFEKDGLFLMINYIDPLEVWDFTQDSKKPILLCKKKQVINDWEYGEIRSSTNPLYLEDYDLWLVFFHSHLLMQDALREYFLGALVFDNDFNIVGYTDKPLFVATSHTKRLLLSNDILPYGCIRQKEDLFLSVGINDSASALMRLPLSRIMQSLKYDSGFIQNSKRTFGGLVNDTWHSSSGLYKLQKKSKKKLLKALCKKKD